MVLVGALPPFTARSVLSLYSYEHHRLDVVSYLVGLHVGSFNVFALLRLHSLTISQIFLENLWGFFGTQPCGFTANPRIHRSVFSSNESDLLA